MVEKSRDDGKPEIWESWVEITRRRWLDLKKKNDELSAREDATRRELNALSFERDKVIREWNRFWDQVNG